MQFTAKYVRYQGSSDWDALYIDGKLDRVGDAYLIDERIEQLLGVEKRYEAPFLNAGTTEADVPKTLEEAELAEGRAARAQAQQVEALEQVKLLMKEHGISAEQLKKKD